MRTVPRLCEVYEYHGICLTNEEKARKTLSQGSRRMPIGTMRTEYTEQSIQTIRIQKHNNKTCTKIGKTQIHTKGETIHNKKQKHKIHQMENKTTKQKETYK